MLLINIVNVTSWCTALDDCLSKYQKYYECHSLVTSDRPELEDTTNPTTHGDWRLYVQNWEAPDDGHKSARNLWSELRIQ
jgi:hypothetical protein